MKNTVCVIPWIHLNIMPKGKVYPCCMTSDFSGYAGDLNTQTIEEIWNSDYMKNLRVQMLNGEEPKMCSRCFEGERSSGQSARIGHNDYFKTKLEEIPVITESDGYVDKIDLKYWDFRFSNLCNYKCRTCGPDYSSAWIPDAKQLGLLNEDASKVISINETINVDFVKEHIETVEKIYFAGGEPLLMDEHWQILDMLDEQRRYDVVLTYNTNASKLTYKNKNVLDYWKKWKENVWLCPSIDEIDERAELIRHGTDWKKMEQNLRDISEIGVYIKPTITVSNMNAHRIPVILQRLIDIGAIRNYENHWPFLLNVLESPAHYNVTTLQDGMKTSIREGIEKFVNEFKNRYNFDIRSKFLHLLWHLEKPFNPELAQKFKEETQKLDKLRDENTLVVIPELDELLK